ncbi:alpha/beta fold hydrolase [Streptomyces goshikiensis]|uniref:alpha/beta fold hydrolase n=1 Tax=Streptomyces goshikiensis TaxID=1942 RepID=UPI002AE0926B|nr:alpha/beta hydrolase [Streptomyces goshikiensis]
MTSSGTKPRALAYALVATAVAVIATASAGCGAAPPRQHGVTGPTATGAADFAGPVDIGGGRKIYLRCRGSGGGGAGPGGAGPGGPTVILESGLHDSSDTWSITDVTPPVPKAPAVFPGVAAFARVCVYDRPGTLRYTDPPALTTRSTPVTGTRSLSAMTSDLDKVLTAARVPGPYLLVGHSFGAMITRNFAQEHPGKVAGLVFVDGFGTDLKELFGKDWPAYLRLLNNPGTAFDSDPGFEKVDIDGAIRAIGAAGPLPKVPLAVLSKTEPFATAPGAPKELLARLEAAWPQVQRSLVELEPQTPQFLATGSDHYVQVHDPDLTISAIRLVAGRSVRPPR